MLKRLPYFMKRIIFTVGVLGISLVVGIDRPFKALACGWDEAKKWG